MSESARRMAQNIRIKIEALANEIGERVAKMIDRHDGQPVSHDAALMYGATASREVLVEWMIDEPSKEIDPDAKIYLDPGAKNILEE